MQDQLGEQDLALQAAERFRQIEACSVEIAGGGFGEGNLVLVDIADRDDARQDRGVALKHLEKDFARQPAGAPGRQIERRRRERERIAARLEAEAQPVLHQRLDQRRQERRGGRNAENAWLRCHHDPSIYGRMSNGHVAQEGPMLRIANLIAVSVVASAIFASSVSSQTLEVKRYNPSEWTKGRFTEIVTVNGPGKTIYLAGVGAEEENAPAGASAPIRHLGDPYQQCVYAYDKIKRALAAQGATLANAVKQVVYVTDIRYQAPVGKCRSEAYAGSPIPANTFLVISGLAIQGMLLEIDVTAVVDK